MNLFHQIVCSSKDSRECFNVFIWLNIRNLSIDITSQQAKDYFLGLKEKELPCYNRVSDFEGFRLYGLEEQQQNEFKLPDIINCVKNLLVATIQINCVFIFIYWV